MMRRWTIAVVGLLLTTLLVDSGDARGRRHGRRWSRVSYNSYSSVGNTSLYGAKAIDPYTQAIAQRKANDMARRNSWFHDGTGFGNGWAEGVGGGRTPQQACSSCCDFNGTIIGQATAQSASGQWFACTIYGG